MPIMTPRTIVTSAAVTLAALAGLTACGSDGDSTAKTLPANVGLEVDAGPGIRYAKDSYTAIAGDVLVALVNNDTQRHTLLVIAEDGTTLPGHLEVAKSGAFDTKEFTLAAGTYKLICDVPGHEDMKATLTVN
jgi:plastocyanin